MLDTQNSLMNGKRKKVKKRKKRFEGEKCNHRLRNYLNMFLGKIMAWNQSLQK